MPQQRTQIYLQSAQHAALKAEAQMLNISLAELMRRIVYEHLTARHQAPTFSKEDYLSLVALGESGADDVAERHDDYLGAAVAADHSD